MTAMTTEFINRSTMYDEVKPYSPKSNHHIAKKNGKLGILNGKGEEVAPCIFDEIIRMKNHTLILRKGDKFGCINRDDDLYVQPIYDEIDNSSKRGPARFRISDRWGWVTSHGMFTDDRNLAYVGIHYTSPNIGPCFCGGGGLGENTVW